MRLIHCPLCTGLAERIGVFSGRTLQYCNGCELVSVPVEERLSRDAQKSRYLLHRNSPEDLGYVARLEEVIALLRSGAPAARRILDYGCGPAPVLLELLRRAGYEADGTDPLFASDAELALRYDAVVCVETMEHFEDPRREWRRLAGLLAPGGALVATTLLHPGRDHLADWWYLRDRTHVAFYSRRTIEYIGDEFGFEVVRIEEGRRIALRRNHRKPSENGYHLHTIAERLRPAEGDARPG